MSSHPNKRLRDDECFEAEDEASDFDTEDLPLEDSYDSESSISSDSENENIFRLPKRKRIRKLSWTQSENKEEIYPDTGEGLIKIKREHNWESDSSNTTSTPDMILWEKFKQQQLATACSCSSITTTAGTVDVEKKQHTLPPKSDHSSGPTKYARNFIVKSQVRSSFFLLITKQMIEHIRFCTESEASGILGQDWKLSEEEFCGFLAILFAQSAYEAKNFKISFLWSKKWGPPFFKETLSRQDFTKILRFIRFDANEGMMTKESIMNKDKFALISKVWNDFLGNSQNCYQPSTDIVIEEQFFPIKTSKANKSLDKQQKFGIKFWIASDVITKYIINGLPALENLNEYGEAVDLALNMDAPLGIDTGKLSSRRWPLRVFFNIIDMAGHNAWILFKEATGENISRKDYLFRLAEELAAIYKGSSESANMHEILEDAAGMLSPGPRKTCQIILCNKNKTTASCGSCKKYVCGVCTERKIAICKKCYTMKYRK